MWSLHTGLVSVLSHALVVLALAVDCLVTIPRQSNVIVLKRQFALIALFPSARLPPAPATVPFLGVNTPFSVIKSGSGSLGLVGG